MLIKRIVLKMVEFVRLFIEAVRMGTGYVIDPVLTAIERIPELSVVTVVFLIALLVVTSVSLAHDSGVDIVVPLDEGDEATVYCQSNVLEEVWVDDLTVVLRCYDDTAKINRRIE